MALRRTCHFCAERVAPDATFCRLCKHALPPDPRFPLPTLGTVRDNASLPIARIIAHPKLLKYLLAFASFPTFIIIGWPFWLLWHYVIKQRGWDVLPVRIVYGVLVALACVLGCSAWFGFLMDVFGA